MVEINSLKKFCLLNWKNWTQFRRNYLFLFLIFGSSLIVISVIILLRSNLEVIHSDAMTFDPIDIETLSVFNKFTKDNTNQPQYILAFSPSNYVLENLMKKVSDKLELKGYKSYTTAKDLELALAQNDYIAGVEFSDKYEKIISLPKHLIYALRFPAMLRTDPKYYWYTKKLFPLKRSGPRNSRENDGGTPVGYVREGFVPIQHAIAMEYMKSMYKIDFPKIELRRLSYPHYDNDQLKRKLFFWMPLLVFIYFFLPIVFITKEIVSEKTVKIKTIMILHGLSSLLQYVSWFFCAFVLLTLLSIILTIICFVPLLHGYGVINKSDWSLFLVFLLLYCTMSIFFCFLISTLFVQKIEAAIFVSFVYIITAIPDTIEFDYRSPGVQMLMCFIPNYTWSYFNKRLLQLEFTGIGAHWSIVNQPISGDDTFPLLTVFIAIVIACITYVLVCFYLEPLIPGEYATHKKWHYPFKKSFWIKNKNKSQQNQKEKLSVKTSTYYMETINNDKPIGIDIQNLRVSFGERVVIKNLTMQMRKDEITVLLGYKDAGKTTIIFILTGMIEPTSGTVKINGHDIPSNISKIRPTLGICPEYNILFMKLTVEEHLIFFCHLRGVDKMEVRYEVDNYLTKGNLEHVAYEIPPNLNKAQKRRLSICNILCGDTKTVIIDEPGIGLDQHQRRGVWSIIKEAKKYDRTIFVCTHKTQEVDAIANILGIMTSGKLMCLGTLKYLKDVYGAGYRLICYKTPDCDVNNVNKFLQQFFPSISPMMDSDKEIVYILPETEVPRFPVILKSLETNLESLKLTGFTIGVLSIEEAYKKVGVENRKSNRQFIKSLAADDEFDENECDALCCTKCIKKKTRIFSKSKTSNKFFTLFMYQWRAMFSKKYNNFRHTLKFHCLQILLPLLIMIVPMVFIYVTTTDVDVIEPVKLALTQYESADIVLKDITTEQTLENKAVEKYIKFVEGIGDMYTVEKIPKEQTTDSYIHAKHAHELDSYLGGAFFENGLVTVYFNNRPLHAAPMALNLVHNAFVQAAGDKESKISVINKPLPYSHELILGEKSPHSIEVSLYSKLITVFAIFSLFFLFFLIKERNSDCKLLQIIAGVRIWIFWTSHLIWDFLIFFCMIILLIIVIIIFKRSALPTFEAILSFTFILMMYGFAMLSFLYFFSFCFQRAVSAFLFLLAVVIITEFFVIFDDHINLPPVLPMLPPFLLYHTLRDYELNIEIRSYCSWYMIQDLDKEQRCREIPTCCTDIGYLGMEAPGAFWEILGLIIQAVVYLSLTMLRDYSVIVNNLLSWRLFSIMPKKKIPELTGEYPDVEAERELIDNMTKSKLRKKYVVIDNVNKRYGRFKVLSNISLVIKRQEFLCLLGGEGSGRSTLFKILCGAIPKSSGDIYVRGVNMKHNKSEILKMIGYCPEEKGLFENLTPCENLRIYFLLRGIKKEFINRMTLDLFKALSMRKQMNKRVKYLTMSNKRKLSLAVALVGAPSVLYLDELTRGVDPIDKLRLWNVLTRWRRLGNAILMSSNNMEECEMISTRLTIIVNGMMHWLGPLKQLVQEFTNILILIIKINRIDDIVPRQFEFTQSIRAEINDVKMFVYSHFSDCILEDEYLSKVKFYISIENKTWSEVFDLMEKNKKQLNIEYYSIGHATLEEILYHFQKSQRLTSI